MKGVMENRMTNALFVLRIVCGLSCTDLGNILGISRQSVHSLQHHKNEMTPIKYYALLYIFEQYAKEYPIVDRLLNILILSDSYSDEEREVIKHQIESICNNVCMARKLGAKRHGEHIRSVLQYAIVD